jgi:hypothetical protein
MLGETWGSSQGIFLGFMIALAIPVVFLAGFALMFSDKEGENYRWHQQVVKSGIATSLLATYLSFMMISEIMSLVSSLGDIMFWVLVTFPIFLFATTGLAAERSIRVMKAWKTKEREEPPEESQIDTEVSNNKA